MPTEQPPEGALPRRDYEKLFREAHPKNKFVQQILTYVMEGQHQKADSLFDLHARSPIANPPQQNLKIAPLVIDVKDQKPRAIPPEINPEHAVKKT